jgi:hypothetical protein
MSAELPAGPELDKLIADKVIGKQAIIVDGQCRMLWIEGQLDRPHFFHKYSNPWAPSTEIADAWIVVEMLWNNFWPVGSGGPRLQATIYLQRSEWVCDICDEGLFLRVSARAETAPLAICRAALKAVTP